MTTARDDIFSNLRRSLGVKGSEAPRLAAVEQRMASAPIGLIPARGQLAHEGQVLLFQQQAEGAQATVARVDSAADVPGEVARYLRDNNLPATLRMGTDPRLGGMNWSETALEVSHGRSYGQDLNAISHAYGGVAETGTLMMVSGPENPTTLNFLPDNHIVVIAAADVAGDMESVLGRIRGQYGKGTMPRTVNMITGPSRSGDIEQTLLLGAHGPRNLHIVIVG